MQFLFMQGRKEDLFEIKYCAKPLTRTPVKAQPVQTSASVPLSPASVGCSSGRQVLLQAARNNDAQLRPRSYGKTLRRN